MRSHNVGRAFLLLAELAATGCRGHQAQPSAQYGIADTCATGDQQCGKTSRESVLLQSQHSVLLGKAPPPLPPMPVAGAASEDVGKQRELLEAHGTNCAARLNSWGQSPAACVVVNDSQALLVYVYYASGWDLPGGHKKDREPACETAERETCEETGYSVRATEQLLGNVFLCEIVAANSCKESVDEGFLPTRWVSREELPAVQWRAHSWGDKVGLLSQQLPDACGCLAPQGWSRTVGRCREGSVTDSWEATVCS